MKNLKAFILGIFIVSLSIGVYGYFVLNETGGAFAAVSHNRDQHFVKVSPAQSISKSANNVKDCYQTFAGFISRVINRLKFIKTITATGVFYRESRTARR
jgi:hypothetical protein